MFEAVENSFRGLISALQMAKLYGTEHAKFLKAVDQAYDGFQAAFRERSELIFGIVGEELAFEKEVMFDLSKATRPMIVFLKSRNIERLSFYRPMLKEELHKLLVFLVTPADEIKKEPREYLAAKGVKNIDLGQIKSSRDQQPGAGGGAGGEASSQEIYHSAIENFSRTLEDVLDDKEMDSLGLQFNVAGIFESLSSSHQDLLKLVVMKRYDLLTFSHILNVSILSMFFSSKLGLSREESLEIGMAALFHDIGKTYISRQIIRKIDKLSPEEFEQVKGHTVAGAGMLLKYVDSLGMLPVLAAFEHHLKSDFQSYPKTAFPQKPHLGSGIIGVCDIYDALCARRSYKTSLPPVVVYGIMLKEKEKLHFPELVDDFFKIMGVFPIGSLVALSDSRIAVVRQQNEEDIFSPQVEAVFPLDKKESLDLKEDKNGLRIDRWLDPLAEGQPYLRLI